MGRIVAGNAAPRFLRMVIELGGCAPFIVQPDADPESAARTLMVAKFRNNGQSCIAANQIFVAEEVANEFVEAFATAAAEHRATGFGLAGYVCGTDLDQANAVARRLRAGIIGINTGTPNYPGAPFSGTGLSGIGYEGGRLGLDEFLHYRTTAVGGR